MDSSPLRGRLQRQLKNFTSLLTSEVLNKATTLVIYGLVARNLTAKDFGQLSLGLMLFYTFQVVATAGLPTIITRSIAQRNRRTDSYCLNGLATAALSGTLGTIAMVLITLLLRYEWDATLVISCLALGLVPHSMALVIESVFRGCERMHFVAVSNVIANLVKVVGALVLFHFNYGILSISLLLIGVRWLILLINWVCYQQFVRVRSAPIRPRFVLGLLKRSLTFLGIDVIIAVWATTDALILSKLATEVEVGLFSAACQLLQPLLLVYKSMVAALFPAMCMRAQRNHAELVTMSRHAILLLLTFGTPLIVALFVFPSFFLEICYGDSEIQAAAPLLQIVCGVLIFRAITSVLGNALWAALYEKSALKIVVVNLVFSVLLGFVLIAWFGVNGAAASVLIVAGVDTLQHWFVARAVFRRPVLHPHMALPILAGLFVLVCVYLTEYRFVTALLGLVVYGLIVLLTAAKLWQNDRGGKNEPAAVS